MAVAVHPRRCGEHWAPKVDPGELGGSSPQVRGTLGAKSGSRRARRFIPAGAGNTYGPSNNFGNIAVHPRRCGEHSHAHAPWRWLGGSSPQVRGTHIQSRGRRVLQRFIPAGAGNTSGRYPQNPGTPVHPRRCGEHCPVSRASTMARGSSPQVRGTLAYLLENLKRIRFIPAGAGNTTPAIPPIPVTTVHPRRCGEHRRRDDDNCLASGSSPQVRGTHCLPR